MLSWENYWPDLLRERIKEAGAGGRNIHVYEGMADSIYHAVGLTAARWPGKTAVVDDKGQALTYGRLLDMKDRMAASLKKKTGIKKGERIGILMYNGTEF